MQALHPPYDILAGLLGGSAVLACGFWLLRSRSTGIRLIESPKLGVLNLLGSRGTAWAAEDTAALARLFAAIRESDNEAPRCDVLLCYCDITESGTVAGSARGLREIIRDARAPIVLVASPNRNERYIAAARGTGFGAANLVMTLDRKGPAFARFFVKLFEKMHQRTSMPAAWVELQPQGGGEYRDDHPDCICLMELGHLVFFDPGIAAALARRKRAA